MIQDIDKYLQEVNGFSADSEEQIERFRIKYLGKKGLLAQLFADFKDVPNEQKKVYGQKINELKALALEKLNSLKENVVTQGTGQSGIDLTMPGYPVPLGTRHPISVIRNRIIEIFTHLGFTISEGPEIEDDWHVFSALNFPEEHPARDMQDTFFIERNPDILLRTHTSSVQVRVMETQQPPIKTISPGRVFRNEVISARAHCIFHQVEGL
ncbi:MAG: phenylalanine--tRNA ligase subunit alpha, partial [Bacteroidota bacterium]